MVPSRMMLAVVVAAVVVWGAAGAPQGLPREFEWDMLRGATLDYPVDFDFLPRNQVDRVLIAEKKGVIRLSIGGVIQPEPFLDISSQVHSTKGARGLISITVDTDFASNKFVYCLFAYETDPGGFINGFKVGRLSRFRVNNDLQSADPTSEKILVGAGQPAQPRLRCPAEEQAMDIICLNESHLIGGLDMDNNGLLYISIGDNSDAGNPGYSVRRSQTLGTMHGKILRVDREGLAPRSNAWHDGDDFSNTSRTFALGFRNGFRIAYDTLRNGVWLGDVGWSKYEEVNFARTGLNFEWPCRQELLDQFQFADRFPECDDMLNGAPAATSKVVGTPTSPAIAYDHDVGAAVTGVVPMLGSSWPEEYRNAVFYVDYVEGWLWYNTVNNNAESTAGPFTFAENLEGPVQIREGADGCLWYLSLSTQEIFKICYAEDTSLPAVRFVQPPKVKWNLERSASITVFISKPVKPSSATNSILLTHIGSGASVPGTTTYDEDKLMITFAPGVLLGSKTRYRITVRGLEDAAGRRMAANHVQVFRTRTGFASFVSDLPLVRAISGGGRPVLLDQAKVGIPIHLNEVHYAKGISVISSSDLFFDVPAGCKRLQGYVGIDDSSQGLEDVGIQMYMRVDGAWKFSLIRRLGRRMKAGDLPVRFDIGVLNKSRVEIRTRGTKPLTSEDTIVSFADLRFRCNTYDGRRPSIVSVSPSDGARNVPQNPQATIVFSEAMDIDSIATGVTITDVETTLPVSWEIGSINPTLTKFVMDTGALEYSRTYEIRFSAGVEDTAGNPVTDAVTSFVWTITTEAEPVEPTKLDVVEELPLERDRDKGSFSRDGFPRTVSPGMQTFPKGLHMRTDSEAVFDLSALGGRTCSSFTAVAGMDAVHLASTNGKCRLKVTSENTSVVDYERLFSPRKVSATLNASLRTGQTELRVTAEKSASTDVRVDCHFGNARLLCDGEAVPMSELSMTSSTGTVSIDREPNNDPLRLLTASSTYENGFSAGADLRIQFGIPHPSCTKFRAAVTIDSDASVANAKMLVRAVTNDVVQCQSPLITEGKGPVPFDCDLSGLDHLQLRFFKQGSLSGAHVALLTDAYLECDTRARRPNCEIAPVATDFAVGDELHFRANAFNFAGIPLEASAIRWDVSLIHCAPECHVHPETVIIGQPEGSIVVPNHGDYFYFQFNCVVEDEGFTARSQAESRPHTVFVNLRTQPPGVRAAIGSFVGDSPLRTEVVLGTTFPVDVKREAPNGYTFSHWVHDGSTDPSFQYTLTTTSEVTFTAVYTQAA